MLLLLQTQDIAKGLGVLLKELYGYTKAKSVIDVESVLPVLLIADKYIVNTVLLRCTEWLDCLGSCSLRDTHLAVSPARGKGACV